MKNVLITGGSRGIGKAMVELFSSNGYRVAFTYKNSDAAAAELESRTGAVAIKADSCVESEVVFACNRASDVLGDIDILINNAAVSSFGLLTDISLDEWNRVMDTCVTGAYLFSKNVLSQMINKKQGRIINISSMWGISGSSCEVHYSATKAALIGMTKALAKELGPSGITVNCIAPGVIDTDMNSSLSSVDLEQLKDDTPMCRIGEPSDVANMALFLADDKASFITGQVIAVDGGYII